MKKEVKKYGNTLIISFTTEECRVYRIKKGSVLDLTDMRVIHNKEVKTNGNNK